jgi:hypothetical protein
VGSLSDIMLGSGAGTLIPVLHGEPVTMLSGLDAGKVYNAVIEIVPDLTISGDGLGMDRRAKRKISFFGPVPRMKGNTKLKTSDGKRYLAIDDPQNGYLATEFELQEITGKDQT